ncbi:MAG: T9SS type A sorting domain-containing protein [Bizionia sp.]|nr:T9SS type A sorting domain-containing protein [Bizionia sp.]
MRLLYILCVALATYTPLTAQNALTNGGFETWSSTTPKAWSGSKTSIATTGVSKYTTNAFEGSSSLALFNPNTTTHKRFTNVAISAANEEYTLRYYAKGKGEIRNAFHDGSYSSYSNYTTFNNTEDWTLIEYVFTPNAGPLEVVFSVRNTANNGVIIDHVVLAKSETLSTNKIENIEDTFSVYPNPTTTGFVNIKSAIHGAIAISVYDVLGKQVISTLVNNNRLNVSSLDSGVYIMQLNQNGVTTSKKLVIK